MYEYEQNGVYIIFRIAGRRNRETNDTSSGSECLMCLLHIIDSWSYHKTKNMKIEKCNSSQRFKGRSTVSLMFGHDKTKKISEDKNKDI